MERAIRIAAELRAESVLLCHRGMTNSVGAQDFWNSQESPSLKFSHFPLCSGEIVDIDVGPPPGSGWQAEQ